MSRRKHVRGRLLACVLGAALVGAASAGGSYTLSNGTFANAGGVVVNGCYRFTATVSEPVAGSVSNGTYALHAGFEAIKRSEIATDIIFRSDFGSQPGDCSP